MRNYKDYSLNYLSLVGLAVLFLLTLTECAAQQPAPDAAPTSTTSASAPQIIATATLLASPTSAPVPTEQPTLKPAPTIVPPNPSPPLTAIPPEPAPGSTPASSPEPASVSTCACDIEHVVIISVDGLRPDALEQADTPSLDGLRAQGAYNPAAQTVLPSVTLVSHASMLSGMNPQKHGIYWNSNDPDLGKVHGPTLFSVAHEAELTTAMVVGKPKFEHLVLPNSVDNYDYAGYTDHQVAAEAITVIQTNMPDLLFIHLPDVDSAGHALGWMSPGQLVVINLTDGIIGEIITTLEAQDYLSRTLLIITADHGGSGLRHGSDSAEDMTIPWLAVGPSVPAGITLKDEIITYDTAATALYAFGLPIPDVWDGRPVMEIFEQEPQ